MVNNQFSIFNCWCVHLSTILFGDAERKEILVEPGLVLLCWPLLYRGGLLCNQ